MQEGGDDAAQQYALQQQALLQQQVGGETEPTAVQPSCAAATRGRDKHMACLISFSAARLVHATTVSGLCGPCPSATDDDDDALSEMKVKLESTSDPAEMGPSWPSRHVGVIAMQLLQQYQQQAAALAAGGGVVVAPPGQEYAHYDPQLLQQQAAAQQLYQQQLYQVRTQDGNGAPSCHVVADGWRSALLWLCCVSASTCAAAAPGGRRARSTAAAGPDR